MKDEEHVNDHEVPVEGPTSGLGQPRRNDPFPDLKIVEIGQEKIDQSPRRVRRDNPTHMAAVKRSMERYGNRIPILVTATNGSGKHRVIDGHHRLAAARELGAERIPARDPPSNRPRIRSNGIQRNPNGPRTGSD